MRGKQWYVYRTVMVLDVVATGEYDGGTEAVMGRGECNGE